MSKFSQNENRSSIRPTKKQFETLAFIESFITEHGYSPSYREIMNGCNYTSVATVALHVNNLINRGHLIKRGRSARSLEVAKNDGKLQTSQTNKSSQSDLVQAVEERFTALEEAMTQAVLDEVYVLVGALKVLGHHELAREYAERISQYK